MTALVKEFETHVQTGAQCEASPRPKSFLHYVRRMRRGPPLLPLSPPTRPAHHAGDGLLCQEGGRLIEKLKRKQIFSIWFGKLCPLTVQANVPVAKQSTSHRTSDNSRGEITQSLWGCHTAFSDCLFPYFKKGKVKHSMSRSKWIQKKWRKKTEKDHL